MNALNAYSHLMSYCNGHCNEPGIEEKFKKFQEVIFNTPEYKFRDCKTTSDVLNVIGFFNKEE